MLDHDTFVRDWMTKYPDATIDDAEDQYAQELVGSLAPLPSEEYVIDRMTTEEKDDLVRAALKCMSELGREVDWTQPREKLDVFAAALSHHAPTWLPSTTDREDTDAIRWWCDFGGHEFPDEVVEEDPSLAAEPMWLGAPECDGSPHCPVGEYDHEEGCPKHEDEGNVDPGACSREISCGAVRHDADCPIAFAFG